MGTRGHVGAHVGSMNSLAIVQQTEVLSRVMWELIVQGRHSRNNVAKHRWCPERLNLSWVLLLLSDNTTPVNKQKIDHSTCSESMCICVCGKREKSAFAVCPLHSGGCSGCPGHETVAPGSARSPRRPSSRGLPAGRAGRCPGHRQLIHHSDGSAGQ